MDSEKFIKTNFGFFLIWIVVQTLVVFCLVFLLTRVSHAADVGYMDADSKAATWSVNSDFYNEQFLEGSYTVYGSKLIPNGIELLVSFNNSVGQPYGFGESFDVGIERFRFINPPVLVSDPQGDIVRLVEGVSKSDIEEVRFTFDPKVALKRALEHVFNVIPKYANADIEFGKVGRTVTIVYPEAGSGGGNVTTDAVFTNGYDVTWTSARDSATADSVADTTTGGIVRALHNGSGYYVQRYGATFDTSAVSSDEISSAVLSLAGRGGTKADGNSTTVDVVSFAPASNSLFVVGDYDAFGESVFSSMNISSWVDTDTVYNDFELNATGLAAIDGEGVTKYGVRVGVDTENTAPASQDNLVQFYMADISGTTSDPVLTITHTASATVPGTEPATVAEYEVSMSNFDRFIVMAIAACFLIILANGVRSSYESYSR